jgi:energy-coupling factor transporter ATP-binding protein EcfA2
VRTSGEGRLVLLAGEAGVGKTTLLEMFRRGLQERVLWGACDPLFTPRPLGPLLDVADETGGELEGMVQGFGPAARRRVRVDAFQHPDSPELSVSIPVGTGNPADAGRARLFGQGADGTWDNFVVTTVDKD